MLIPLLAGLTKDQKHELEKLSIPHSRISEWKSGKRKPTLAQIMVLTMVTNSDPKPLIAWLAEQEATPAQRELFREHKAGRLGLIFTVILSVLFSVPERAFSSVGIADNVEPSRLDRLHIVVKTGACDGVALSGLRDLVFRHRGAVRLHRKPRRHWTLPN